VGVIASLGLAGAAAQASIAVPPSPGRPAPGTGGRACAAADRSPAPRPGTGATAYVANDASGTVTPITIATGKAGSAIKVGTDPDTIVIAPGSPG